jgi:excisionase family DNA binding protein
MENQIFISVNETAKRLSCGVTLIYEQINAGCYRTVKLGKKRLIDRISLESWAANLPTEPLKSTVKGN